ncbi:MAG: MerR family transcriptional regulator [Acidimicrobiia bacterium]|nr:MerR family transcriptional regulator [bacterium]MXX01400.1 MerR family transcriptional regulator [Acidimicrobiia bacterium]MDE0673672.1 MerR family transcriptional regulator [bacterium]MXX46356.1 MerR family transcriptional regulator [Acidimicrobiia bacterium]MXY74902.1 MerR family transcriptional regulator [Acidimicrobiia bacterium]
MTEQRDLSIGEVIKVLRRDFPEITVSKVRFLESKGMISPRRTDGGYRRFDRTDVARLRYILGQQRDHFLPLKVIKSKLAAWERGDDPHDPAGSGGSLLEEAGEPIARADVLRRSDLRPDQLDDLVAHRLISPLPDDEDIFPPEAGPVASEAKRLMDRGLSGRHLRSIRLAVDREVDLFRSVAAPLTRVQWLGEGGEHVQDLLLGCADALVGIHRALLLASLRGELRR